MNIAVVPVKVSFNLCLLVLLASLCGCVDTTPPEWANEQPTKANPGTADTTGLTAIKEGQACSASELAPPADSLRIHFIDVGQGDAIWVQSPSGENVLIDAGDGGHFGRTNGGELVVKYLLENGFQTGSTFDAVVVTHPHSDHYGGLKRVMGSYRAAAFMDPGVNSESASYKDVLGTFNDVANIFRPALGGDGAITQTHGGKISIFGTSVNAYLLSSDSSLRLGSDDSARINNSSIVIKLEYAGKSALFMGDAHTEVESELLRRFVSAAEPPTLDSNILKVGHHGSSTSTSSLFLDGVFRNIDQSQRYAVISSGRLAFSGTTLPRPQTVFGLQRRIDDVNIFSTEAGDDLKGESEAAGDDDVLAVIKSDGSMYVCYP